MILKTNSKVNCSQSKIIEDCSESSSHEIQKLLKNLLTKNGNNMVDQSSDGTINLNHLSALEFHSIQLKLEERGIPFEIERATLIHIAV